MSFFFFFPFSLSLLLFDHNNFFWSRIKNSDIMVRLLKKNNASCLLACFLDVMMRVVSLSGSPARERETRERTSTSDAREKDARGDGCHRRLLDDAHRRRRLNSRRPFSRLVCCLPSVVLRSDRGTGSRCSL